MLPTAKIMLFFHPSKSDTWEVVRHLESNRLKIKKKRKKKRKKKDCVRVFHYLCG